MERYRTGEDWERVMTIYLAHGMRWIVTHLFDVYLHAHGRTNLSPGLSYITNKLILTASVVTAAVYHFN